MVKMWYYAGMLFLRARELPTTKGEKMLKRGFISRSASVVTLVGALALLSSISGVTAGTIDDSVGNAQQSPSSLVFSSASADGFSYSRWLENQGTVPASADSASTDESQADQGQAPITYGSFVLTETPLERIYGNVKDSWTQTFSNIITRAGDTSMLRGWAMDYVTGQEVDIQAGIDSWWDQRQADTTGIFVGMADVLTDNIFQAGEDQVGGMSFIRSLDWDYQTELGGRPWQLGVNAIGSLREADDDVMLWQLRGFTAKDSKGGANAGLIYRWAQEDTAMFGVNTFLDFEAHDRGDFLRWSVGGEVRTEWIDLYGNRYMAITDPRLQDDGNYAYSKDGLDLEAAFHVPDMRWVSGYIKYYLFEGQGTDPESGDNNPDEKGFVYGVKVSPPMAENLRLELELDDQDGGDLDVGGRISYRHEFGGIPAGTRSASTSSSFDPRDYFFDAVRREYAQRIGIYGAGGDVASLNRNALGASMFFSSLEGTVLVTVLVDYKNPSHTFSTADPITIVVLEADDGTVLDDGMTVAALINDIAGIKGSSYDMSLSKDTHISYEYQGAVVSLTLGEIFIDRNGGSPESIGTPNMKVDLIGTDLRIAYAPSAAVETAIELYEGEISLTYATGASFEASVANDAQIHDGDVTYYACNGASKIGNFIGVTSLDDCALTATITPDPTAGNIIAAVGLTTKAELAEFKVSKGVGKYTFQLTSNPKNYFEWVQDASDSNTFRISVLASVPDEEDGQTVVIEWRVNDGFDGVDSGKISVQFTKAPNADNELRYAVVGVAYNETISIPVSGGKPDDTTGDYTFALVPAAGYTIDSNSGKTIVLNVAVTSPVEGVSFVTVSIQDSQTPPQSGTFVLEVRVVPVLTFSDATFTISQTESASFLSAVGGGNTMYAEDNTRTYEVISESPQFTADNDGVLAVGAGAAVATTTVTVRAMDTVPPQTVIADLVIDVLFKATPVMFDIDNIDLRESIDPGVDTPLSITLKATGGAQTPSYTFSITENDATWLTIVSPDVLVVGSGAPGSGSHTFKVEVEDSNSTNTDGTEKAELEITFTFAKPLASATANGNVEVSGSESADGSYTSGQTFTFDPKTEQGVTLALGGASDTAVVTAENDQIQVTLKYFTQNTPALAAFTPSSGTFVMLDGKKLAQAMKDGIDAGKVAISFGGGTDNLSFSVADEIDQALALKGGLLAIIAPAGLVNGDGVDVVSEVTYLLCNINGFDSILCELKEPASTSFAQSSSRQLQESSTSPTYPPRPPSEYLAARNAGFESVNNPGTQRVKSAIIIGNQIFPISRANWDFLIGTDNFQLVAVGGIWRITETGGTSQTDIVAEIAFEFPGTCTVTLPDTTADDCRSHISSPSSSFASAS